MTEEVDARLLALMERIDRMLTMFDAQLQEAIKREDVRLTAIEARLTVLELRAQPFSANRDGQRSDYTDRDPAKAMALLNRDG
jgi:hypothetical protein